MYVGDPCASVWGNGDIGAQILAAVTALSAPGGKVVIIPKVSGACYDDATTVPLTTLGKYIQIEWAGSNGFLGTSTPQNCINWTLSSGTAFTIDYSTGTGIPAASTFGLKNIFLINNNCVTNGGCGG